jgi:hypothetical protein
MQVSMLFYSLKLVLFAFFTLQKEYAEPWVCKNIKLL